MTMNESTKHLIRQNAAILSQDELTILNSLAIYFRQAVYDPKRNLYILYNRDSLRHDAQIASIYARNIAGRILQRQHKTVEFDDLVHYNPCKQAIQFEQLVEQITDEYQLQKIFDYLPYTKDQKFNLNNRIHVKMLQFTMPAFDKTPERTVNHQALTIWPFSGISGYGMLCSEYEKLPQVNNIAVMVYTPPKYTTGDKRPPDILLDDGSFQSVKRKSAQKTINPDMLTPGTSYLDSKGVEHLYLGKLTQTTSMPKYQKSTTVQNGPTPMYLRVTENVRTQLTAAKSMAEFLKNRLEEKGLDPKIGDIMIGISQAADKKLKTQKTVFFQPPDNLVKDLRIIRKNPINPIADQLIIISTE